MSEVVHQSGVSHDATQSSHVESSDHPLHALDASTLGTAADDSIASLASWTAESAFVPRVPMPLDERDGQSIAAQHQLQGDQTICFDSPMSSATDSIPAEMLSDLELSRVLSRPATDHEATHSGAEEDSSHGRAEEHNRSLLFPRIGLGVDEPATDRPDEPRIIVFGGTSEQRKSVIVSLDAATQMRPEEARDRISFYRSRLAGLFSHSLSATLETLLLQVLATSSAGSLVDACVAIIVASSMASLISVIPVLTADDVDSPTGLLRPTDIDAASSIAAFTLASLTDLAAALRQPSTMLSLRRRNAESFVAWRKSLDSLAASPSFPPATTAEQSEGPVSEVEQDDEEVQGGMESSASFPPPIVRSRSPCRPAKPVGAAAVIMPNRHDPLNIGTLFKLGFNAAFETVFRFSAIAAIFCAGAAMGIIGTTLGSSVIRRYLGWT